MRRRDFLTASLTASAFAFTARSYAQIAGANNRVRLALIGCGGRGMFVARLMREAPETQFVAACDVYDANAGRAKEWMGGEAEAYRDFRRALDRKDIDAVLVATPDHWHAIPTVLACQAGKDVYVEKPLAHNVREGRAMVDAARKHKRIVQTGTQHRSAPHYRQIQEIITRGDIGAVRFVRVWNYVNRVRGFSGGDGATGGRNSGNLAAQPPGLDWDFYLGPAPLVPFDRTRFLGSFRNYFDYAGGYVTDWGTHRFDSVRQVMNEANPLTASASGRRYELKDGGDTPDVVQATVQFPEFTMSYEAIQINGHGAAGRTPEMKYYRMAGAEDRPHGEAFYGTKGTIIADRIGFDLYPEPVGNALRGVPRNGTEAVPYGAPKRQSIPSRDTTDLHTTNFIDCVRTRKPPSAEVEIGHLSSIVPHLINIAYRTGEKLQWNAASETIKGDPDSSALLTRRARPPWNIVEGT
jgi:predicted dehydrogenase